MTQAEVVTQAARADPMKGFGNDQSYLESVLKREVTQDPKELCITSFVFHTCEDTIPEVQSVNGNSYRRYIAEGRSGFCFSCGVWLPTAPNLTSVKVRIKTTLELWKD